VQHRAFDSNKSALLSDVYGTGNKVHLADMTEHRELLFHFGFNSYRQVSYKTMELYITSAHKLLYGNTEDIILDIFITIMFLVLKHSARKQENYYGYPYRASLYMNV
jgi:hypothetical protein